MKDVDFAAFDDAREKSAGTDISGLVEYKDPARPESSPLLIHGLQWAGAVTASVQVWARDLETSQAVQKNPTWYNLANRLSGGDASGSDPMRCATYSTPSSFCAPGSQGWNR